MRILLVSGLVVFFTMLTFGISCYQSAPAPTPASTPSPTPTITEVEISGFAFVPATITIPVGTTVTWFNKDSVAHTVSSRADVFDSGNLSGGATFSYTFDQKGSFEYYCKLHPSMRGKVIVE
jgi:plastocyanin